MLPRFGPMDFDKVSLERLLGRVEEDVLDACDASRLRGQHALVTGAGGSVGAALLRKLGRYAPASLTLFDHSEFHLFQIESELRQAFPSLPIASVLGDVSRRAEIRAACRRHRPAVIYHAAAYKHVAMAETAVIAAARVNVLGTVEVVAAAREVGARLVLVSSDKAAAPRGVMGATKRFAELFALQRRSRRVPPIAVRFGNVLGSSGSVLEIMVRAAAAGRKVPVTSPEATRFFMTAEEAASLVLKAGLMGRGGEVFWLEMGAPLRIGDLATRVIAYATPPDTEPAGIDVIGLRPGEKLREELTSHGL
ncbi:MAG TPA: polysaccharide biosynthesis protein, partial [Vicinamibacterales bacterium]|nr:polysaccharide biosynthesis protein [Vicinamibacterales bacterium]